MKRFHPIPRIMMAVLLAAIILCSPLMRVDVSAASFSEGGYIVLPDNPDDQLTAAADTLAKYLNQVTGKTWPVAASGEGMKFVLAYTDEVADNGYIIETGENEVSIQGCGVRGVIHGVYAFLEKYCDCHWYTSGLYEIPQNPELSIPAGEKTEYEPFFEYTETDWLSPRDVEYSLANGLTGGVYRDIPGEYGGEVGYIGSFCHTLSTSLCASGTYFAEHPEYFALNGGSRKPTQLCLTNEKVYEIVRDEVFAWLEENHDPQASVQIVSLTQADNTGNCRCDSCKAIDDANGSPAGTMITFVNRIARDVKAAGYDNVAIDTFAYQYTRSAPTNVVPDDNVIVRLCTIECCHAHTFDDPDCNVNALFMKDLADWKAICERIYIWDYSTNYNHTSGIFPDFGTIQRNIQLFYESNVKGVYMEGNYYMGNCDAEFGELKAYLLSKLMQNPYMDFDAAMEDFNNAFYGAAGEHITEFVKMTMEKPVPKNGHLGIYFDMTKSLGFDKADVEAANTLWEAAKAATQSDAVSLERVERSELSWRYWKCYQPAYSDPADIDALLADMAKFGIGQYKESGAGLDVLGLRILSYHIVDSNIFLWVAFLLTLIITIIAIKQKKRNYVIAFVLCVASIGIFAWQEYAYLSWNARAYPFWMKSLYLLLTNIPMWLTFGLIAALFGYLGSLAVRGRITKKIVIWVCVILALACHLYGILYANHFYHYGATGTLGIGVGFSNLGILGILIQSVSLVNILLDVRRSKKQMAVTE